MHAHACQCYNLINMRTTVEMKSEHRSALLALAARRGEKGFSSVLGEAIEEYLEGQQVRAKRRKEILSLKGSISGKDATDLRKAVAVLRGNWR